MDLRRHATKVFAYIFRPCVTKEFAYSQVITAPAVDTVNILPLTLRKMVQRHERGHLSALGRAKCFFFSAAPGWSHVQGPLIVVAVNADLRKAWAHVQRSSDKG